ncbi:hypothetical protein NJ284_13200 [Xanthomonas citri pv. anacardii]|uniref:hypothetical protein n=1 Tax=Xanthomonas citri TaxID=346 RepID=UPI0015E1AA01|nr:hypothetical protein [Xanthomonas citri]
MSIRLEAPWGGGRNGTKKSARGGFFIHAEKVSTRKKVMHRKLKSRHQGIVTQAGMVTWATQFP